MALEPATIADSEQALEEVLLAYFQAVERQQTPDREEWLARYPHLAADLQLLFADQAELEGLLAPLCARPAGLPPEPEGEDFFEDLEVLEKVSRGGMGVVYKARELSLQRLVALKVIRADRLQELSSEQRQHWVQRFRDEAKAVAELDHPNIIPIWKVGEGRGQPFFTMKLVEGGSLAQWIAACRGRPAVGNLQKIAAQLIATVARAVHHAHQHGILHRDLKPANILLQYPEPANAQMAAAIPLVTDFGLASRLEQGPFGPFGAIEGTPAYMAPEQARGERNLSTGVDVYGLGAILHELLTGNPPFTGKSKEEILNKVRSEQVAFLKDAGVHRDLEAICLKCLAKEAGNRYASAEALAQDLDRYLEGRPVQARLVGRWTRALKWARRRPAIAALVAVIALSGAGLLVGTAWHVAQLDAAFAAEKDARQDAEQEKKIADEARERALKQRDRAYRAAMNLGFEDWKTANMTRLFDSLGTQGPAPGEPDLRDFEWHLLLKLCQQDRLSVRGHKGAVRSLAVSPDGRLVFSAGRDGTWRRWDLVTGTLQKTVPAGQGQLAALALSADGRVLATAGDEHFIALWDPETGVQREILEGHQGKIRALAISPDGAYLASGSEDKTARLWELATGKEVGVLKGHLSTVDALCFSPDGQRLATGGHDERVRIWDVHSQKRLDTIIPARDRFANIWTLAFSPDGAQLAVGTYHSKIWLLYLAQKRIKTLAGHTGSIAALKFAAGGLISASQDGTIKLWNLKTETARRTLQGHRGAVAALAVTADGKSLVSAGRDGTLKVWDLNPPRLACGSVVYSLAFSASGKTLAAGDAKSTISLWDADTGMQQRLFQGHQDTVYGLAFSPDGNSLASASADKTVRLWDLQAAKPTRVLWGHHGQVKSVAFSPSGALLASGSGDNTAKIWDLFTGKEPFTLAGHADTVNCAAFSPDGTILATASWDGTVRLWDVATGVERRTLRVESGAVMGLAFSLTGNRLAAGGIDQTIYVWNWTTGQLLTRCKRHNAPVTAVAFSPSGTRIASVGADHRVRLWDAATGDERGSWLGGDSALWAVAFSPDSQTLASAGEDRLVRLWRAATKDEVHSWERVAED